MNNAFRSDPIGNIRISIVELLNARLADAIDLKLCVKQAHWNVRGLGFMSLHELFDQIAGRLDKHADTLAERVVQLGSLASGTSHEVVELSSLPAYPTKATAQTEHLSALRHRLSVFAMLCRSAVDDMEAASDAVTADILTEIARSVEKDHWFVAAHLDQPPNLEGDDQFVTHSKTASDLVQFDAKLAS